MGKPTLGYASRTEAVFGLRGQGLTTRQIATRIGIPVSTVSALEHSAGRTRKPRPAEQFARTVVIPIDVLDRLRPAAAARCITVNHLVRDIVAAVVDDDLLDAVLDDEFRNAFREDA